MDRQQILEALEKKCEKEIKKTNAIITYNSIFSVVSAATSAGLLGIMFAPAEPLDEGAKLLIISVASISALFSASCGYDVKNEIKYKNRYQKKVEDLKNRIEAEKIKKLKQ